MWTYTVCINYRRILQNHIPFPPNGRNGTIARTSAVSHVGRTSNAFKVTMKLQTFLFQMVVKKVNQPRYRPGVAQRVPES